MSTVLGMISNRVEYEEEKRKGESQTDFPFYGARDRVCNRLTYSPGELSIDSTNGRVILFLAYSEIFICSY
jgi:hypothetical protein